MIAILDVLGRDWTVVNAVVDELVFRVGAVIGDLNLEIKFEVQLVVSSILRREMVGRNAPEVGCDVDQGDYIILEYKSVKFNPGPHASTPCLLVLTIGAPESRGS